MANKNKKNFFAQISNSAPVEDNVGSPAPVEAEVVSEVPVETKPVETAPVEEIAPTPAPVEDTSLQTALEGTKAAVEATGVLPAPTKVDRYPDRKRRSDIASPVKAMWEIADMMIAADPTARRKDIIAAGIASGIAFYTARTQYQAWYTARRESLKNAAQAQAAQAQAQ
jgi:hypothetical protein